MHPARPAAAELSAMGNARDNNVMPQAMQVAVVQHNAGTDVERNLSTLETLSIQAASEGAQLITWAEAFAYLGRHDGKEILEPLPEGGPILDRCRALATKLNCDLLLGGFHEAMPGDPDRCYNTSVYLNSRGEITATYRKIHLFDVSIPNGPQLMESKQTGPGDKAVCVASPIGHSGTYRLLRRAVSGALSTLGGDGSSCADSTLSIYCYDRRSALACLIASARD